MRAGNITIVELHNHGLTEEPRLFYMHYWAVDDAVTLARALRRRWMPPTCSRHNPDATA